MPMEGRRWCSGGARLPTLNLGAWYEWVVNANPRPPYPQERQQVPIVQEAG